MSVGGEPGHLHPKATERSGYRYFFYDKHHGRGGPEAARWVPELTDDEEFAIFDQADLMDFSDGHDMSSAMLRSPQITFPGEEFSWAGESPWYGRYCLGTENGKLLLIEDSGAQLKVIFEEMLAEEAINGVAFWNDFVGVSTRSEVAVYHRDSSDRLDLVCSGPGGAHGIVATARGQFVAPMGIYGLFCVDLTSSSAPRAWTESARSARLYFYSLAHLGELGDSEVLACAGRSDGLLRIQLATVRDESVITRLTSPDVDFVGVCSLASKRHPFAMAALCHDGSIQLIRNLLLDEKPQTLRTESIQGTPYEIRAAAGHLFVLTSEHVTFFPNFASWYLDGAQCDRSLHYRQMSVSAADIFIAYDELLLLTDNGVGSDRIQDLAELRGDAIVSATQSESAGWTENEGVPDISTSAAQWVSAPVAP